MRSSLTSAEAYLWNYLKSSKLAGRKFRRQHSFDKYIIDFNCPSEKLGVELDGEVHFNSENFDYDEKRSQFLKSMGIKIIRFENEVVFNNTEYVLNVIKENFKGNHPVTS